MGCQGHSARMADLAVIHPALLALKERYEQPDAPVVQIRDETKALLRQHLILTMKALRRKNVSRN